MDTHTTVPPEEYLGVMVEVGVAASVVDTGEVASAVDTEEEASVVDTEEEASAVATVDPFPVAAALSAADRRSAADRTRQVVLSEVCEV